MPVSPEHIQRVLAHQKQQEALRDAYAAQAQQNEAWADGEATAIVTTLRMVRDGSFALSAADAHTYISAYLRLALARGAQAGAVELKTRLDALAAERVPS